MKIFKSSTKHEYFLSRPYKLNKVHVHCLNVSYPILQVKEEASSSTEDTPAEETTDNQSQIDIESLRSLSDVGIDMSFLDDYGNYTAE